MAGPISPDPTSVKPRWWTRLAAIVITIVAIASVAWQVTGDKANIASGLLFVGDVATFLVVGVVIIERRPGNIIGPLLFVAGVWIVLYLLLNVVVATADPRAVLAAAWLVGLLDAPMLILVSALFLQFPDGRLPSPPWRMLLVAELGLVVVVIAWSGTRPGPLPYYPQVENPLGSVGGPLEVLGPFAYLLLVLGVALSALTLVGRWRSGGALERAQLKWAASAAALATAAMASYTVVVGPATYSPVFDLFVGLALGFFPIAIGIAILRYRLFEIDRIISRTIGYAVVTVVLFAAFLSVNLVLQNLISGVSGDESPFSVALSTLVVAVLFTPVRTRIQSVVDRRFHRARYDAERTTVAFSDRLRDQLDLPSLADELDTTVRAVIAPSSLSVWLRRPVR